jgi:hypothetical protein
MSSNNWGQCSDLANNNIHNDKPALMQDGRLYTAYNSSDVTMEKIKQSENLQTNWEYRNYLQKNANEIMKYNNIECFYSLGINPNTSFDKKMPSQPVLITEPCYKISNKNSDLKNYYLSRQELNSKMISPSIIMNNYDA